MVTYGQLIYFLFVLSSASSWNVIDINFNYEEFYNSIVDYFEVTLGPAAKAVINELLQWWDKCVYIICALLYRIADSDHGPARKVFGHSKYGALYLAVPHVSTLEPLTLVDQRNKREAHPNGYAMLWWS